METKKDPKQKAIKKAKRLLVKAIEKNDTETLKGVFAAGINVDSVVKDPKITPLMVCASSGQIECFNVIMDLNPDVMKLDSTGKTALHYAARAGNLNVLKELCQNEDVDVDL